MVHWNVIDRNPLLHMCPTMSLSTVLLITVGLINILEQYFFFQNYIILMELTREITFEVLVTALLE